MYDQLKKTAQTTGLVVVRDNKLLLAYNTNKKALRI